MLNQKKIVKNLSFYDEYPTDTNISLRQLEKLILKRISILNTFNHYHELRINFTNEWMMKIDQALAKVEIDSILNSISNDNLSHWMLLLTICFTSKIDQIVHNENDFFAWKLASLSPDQVKHLFKTLPLPFQEITDNDKANLPVFCEDYEIVKIYRIKFHYVKDLVSSVNIFLYLGYAYVPEKLLSWIIYEYFGENLTKKISFLRQIRVELTDKRIPFLETIVKERLFSNSDSYKTLNQISIKNLDAVAKLFPLCMRTLYETFKEKKFLNHFKRRQLILFFKGAGLDVSICHEFFYNESMKRISPYQYHQKRYAYEIDYCYGIVGNRNWRPYDCAKIINEKTINTEQGCTACPFSMNNSVLLEKSLEICEIEILDIEDIVRTRMNSDPQAACAKLFEIKCNKKISRIKHPNQYFAESYKIKQL